MTQLMTQLMTHRLDYPNLWQRGLIQPRVRARANHRCEKCGMEFCEGTNIAKTAMNSKGKPLIGTVHHIDENKQNCSMVNLVYLCQRCHFITHLGNWYPGKPLLRCWENDPPRWIVERGIPFTFNSNVFNAPSRYEELLILETGGELESGTHKLRNRRAFPVRDMPRVTYQPRIPGF